MRRHRAWIGSLSLAGVLTIGLFAQVNRDSAKPTAELVLAGMIVAAPGSQAVVLAPATGRILYATDPPKNVGDRVQAGEPLCILEHHFNYHDYSHLFTERWPLLKAFLTAKRKMVEAKLAAQRIRYLYEAKAVALRDAEEAEAGYREANAEFEGAESRLTLHDAQIAKSELTRRPLLSPISGRIVDATFHQGQMVYEGNKIYTILDISKVWVKAEVYESDLARLLKVKEASILATALPHHSFRGRLVEVSPQVKESSRTVEVFFEVPNRDDALKIGMQVATTMVRQTVSVQ